MTHTSICLSISISVMWCTAQRCEISIYCKFHLTKQQTNTSSLLFAQTGPNSPSCTYDALHELKENWVQLDCISALLSYHFSVKITKIKWFLILFECKLYINALNCFNMLNQCWHGFIFYEHCNLSLRQCYPWETSTKKKKKITIHISHWIFNVKLSVFWIKSATVTFLSFCVILNI